MRKKPVFPFLAFCPALLSFAVDLERVLQNDLLIQREQVAFNGPIIAASSSVLEVPATGVPIVHDSTNIESGTRDNATTSEEPSSTTSEELGSSELLAPEPVSKLGDPRFHWLALPAVKSLSPPENLDQLTSADAAIPLTGNANDILRWSPAVSAESRTWRVVFDKRYDIDIVQIAVPGHGKGGDMNGLVVTVGDRPCSEVGFVWNGQAKSVLIECRRTEVQGEQGLWFFSGGDEGGIILVRRRFRFILLAVHHSD